MSLEVLRSELDATGELPLREAIPLVATALQGRTLLLPVASHDKATGDIELLTGKDASGNAWIYAYTGEDVMEADGLSGVKYGNFDFLDVVRMGLRGNFGGIAIDGGGDSNRAMIPDYWFAEIDWVLGG